MDGNEGRDRKAREDGRDGKEGDRFLKEPLLSDTMSETLTDVLRQEARFVKKSIDALVNEYFTRSQDDSLDI